ncbi:MAG TPA: L,D-transpeptidase family protein [Longimicrobiales bacterium]|nr:L,D-transpeptidase family protein [Longimicrobiales bacterium]
MNGRWTPGRWALPAVAAMLLVACGTGGAMEEESYIAALQELTAGAGEDSVFTLASGDTVRLSAPTLEFYALRQHRPAWWGRRGLDDRGAALLAALGDTESDGLPSARYRHDVVTSLLSTLDPEDRGDRLPDSVAVRYRAAVDVLLTEGMVRYAGDLVTGTLDPADAGVDWRIERESARHAAVLENLDAGRDPQDILAQLRPSLPYYDRMRTALAQYRAAAERGGWPQLPENETLKEGDRSDAVAALRQRLLLGTDAREAELARAGEADPSLFDAQLKEAVQHFQHRHSIEADGAVGGGTLKELNHPVEDRIAEMKLNLDRWRWLPNELGERFVMVNIAGFELEVVEDGRAIESMNVVVGRLDRQTPVFADSIQFVVVNPYWNVPNGIFEKDVQPKMQADPMYLVRNNMEMVDGRVRQKPGPTNSLGRFKFLFPNEFDVYLHDSPERHLFSRTSRDFSSGCIRIERPEDFARLLLDMQTDAGSGQLDSHLTHWNEQWMRLDRPLPVYLLYFTAWVEEDGTVRFHHDVYNRDEMLAPQVEDRLEPAPAQRVAGTATGV